MSEATYSAAGAVVVLSLVLLIVRLLRPCLPGAERFHVPSSLVGGLVLILCGPHVAGRWVGSGSGFVPPEFFAAWKTLPGLLINVVFAGLFVGKAIPPARRIWRIAAPQALFGQTMAWGQYVIGLLLALLVLEPLYGLTPMAGALIEMGFQGGHGIASGLSDTFMDLGFSDGIALADGLATWGVAFGVILGTLVVNFAERSSRFKTIRERFGDLPGDDSGDDDAPALEPASTGPGSAISLVDPLSINIGWVLGAVAVGWLIQRGLAWFEATTYGSHTDVVLLGYVPLFPLAMVGGILIQLTLEKFQVQHWVSRRLVERIADAALDFTILSAVATLSVRTIGAHWEAFLFLAVAGTLWCCFCLWFFAPRMLDQNWLERGVCDFGQSMGMTAVGLLLLRIADPKNRTEAVESFGYKQLLFEPFVGGGLVTTAALPVIFHFGAVPLLVFSATLCALCIGAGIRWFGPRNEA